MHLYAFVQAAEIWVKTEDTCSWANPLVTAKGSELPPQNVLIALQSGGEISPRWREAEPLLCAPRRAPIRLFLSKAGTSWGLGVKQLNWRAANSTVRQRIGVRLLHSQWSPAQQQIQPCASLPPGGGFCYVPWLALMQGDLYSPQRNCSWRCWISPVTDSWHHGYSFGLCSSLAFVCFRCAARGGRRAETTNERTNTRLHRGSRRCRRRAPEE